MEISNEQWRCPICETVNRTECCEICGTEKSVALKMLQTEKSSILLNSVNKDNSAMEFKDNSAMEFKEDTADAGEERRRLLEAKQRLQENLSTMWKIFAVFMVVGIFMLSVGILAGGITAVFFAALGGIIHASIRSKQEKIRLQLLLLPEEDLSASTK